MIFTALFGEVSQYKSSTSLFETQKDFAINLSIYFVASQFSAAFFTDIFSLSPTTFQKVSCLAQAVAKILRVKSFSSQVKKLVEVFNIYFCYIINFYSQFIC